MNTTELAIKAALRAKALARTPAEAIVTRPGHELWRYGANPAQMAEELCRNVYWYGHNGAQVWVWDAGSGGNPTGEALARGMTAMTNCGGFNLAARWIGVHVLDMDPTVFVGSYTHANDCFVTLAGTAGIDRNWHGNVRTLTQDFQQVGAYFFKAHSWSRYIGNMLDASTNTMNFHAQTDLYWCSLQLANGQTSGMDGRAFLVTQRYQNTVPIPGTAPYACVSTMALKKFRHFFPIVAVGQGITQSFINGLPDTTGHGWSTFLLASRSHLPQEFRDAVKLL